jgi:putative transcriptional regulator
VNNDLPERRDQRGMSQADLAAAVGVSRQTINAIERDRYDPSLDLAFDLAEEFGCRIEDIFAPDEDTDG